MAQFTTRRGTIIETTSIDINVEQSRSAALRRTGTTVEASVENSESQILVVALSQSSDFSLFDDFNLSPKADDVARRSAVRRGTPEPAAIDIAVPASANERAALLIENEGVFTWHFPSEETPSRRGGRREVPDLPTLTFRIPIGVAPGTFKPDGRRGLFDAVVGDLFQPIKAYVFKFAARHAVGAGSRWLERNVKPGEIVIQSDDITTWRATSPLPETTVTSPKAKRILLFIHGTFSSTLGSFGALALTPQGKAFIEAAKSHYDIILGFDHRTLSEGPEQNAEAIVETLSHLKVLPGAEVDIIAFSRGGLIARLISERLFARDDSSLRIKKVVFIGCTNSGTALANPENWKAFLDLYTNLAVVAGRGLTLFGAVGAGIIIEESVKTLADFVRALVEVSVTGELVPGLAAMAPKGALVADLNASASKIPAARAEYFAIGSDFESGEGASGAGTLPQRLVRAIADMNVDSLMGAANDLVVDNASMTSFGPMKAWLQDSLLWKANAKIFHTNYFAQGNTSLALRDWLIEGLSSLPTELRESDTVDTVEVSPPSGRRRSPAQPGDDRLVARERADNSFEVSLESLRPEADEAASDSSADVRCYFAAEMPESNPIDRPTDLAVTISREDLSKKTNATVAADSGAVKPDELIKIEVRALSNCRVVGNHVLDVRVPAAGKPDEYKFAIAGLIVGPAELWVDISQHGSRVVRLVLQPIFIAEKEIIRAEAKGSAQSPEGGMVELRIIEESANNDKYRLRFILQSADLAVGPINLVQEINREKDKIVADFYHQLEGAWGDGAEFDTFMDQIRTYGANIYNDVVPKPIKDVLWTCRGRIGCIQVFSGEPSIPWEILFTVDDTGSIADDGKFLGELGLVRWLDNTHWPPSRLSVSPERAFFVIPDYADPRFKLKGASLEAAMLKEFFGATAVSGSRSDVIARLDKGSEIDLIHFACHGSASEDKIWNAALLMAGKQREDGTYVRETLTLNDIKLRARLRRENSSLAMVFVNACQAGKMGRTISGTGGIADAFISKGAGLFVSSLWSIGDDVAHTFAQEFYRQLLEGATVVQATSSARRKARDVAEPTWLAYAVYGHPYARVSVAKGQ